MIIFRISSFFPFLLGSQLNIYRRVELDSRAGSVCSHRGEGGTQCQLHEFIGKILEFPSNLEATAERSGIGQSTFGQPIAETGHIHRGARLGIARQPISPSLGRPTPRPGRCGGSSLLSGPTRGLLGHSLSPQATVRSFSLKFSKFFMIFAKFLFIFIFSVRGSFLHDFHQKSIELQDGRLAGLRAGRWAPGRSHGRLSGELFAPASEFL